MQELFAGIGVAVAVALVFAVTVANSSITNSARSVVRTVIGPANLQLEARGPEGFDERLVATVEHLPHVKQAAPLLEQIATVVSPTGRRLTVDVAGTDAGLAFLDGLAETLPLGALQTGGIGLSKTSASELRLSAGRRVMVALQLRGRTTRLRVSAVLGHETAGALAEAWVAVMPLAQLQKLAGLHGRVTRILVQSEPGHALAVEREMRALAAGRITVAPADQDIALLHQALEPSNQASALFAGLSALLGFLFAFNAMLLTVPERREAIADLRLDGAKRTGITQLVIFQAICLGVAASLVGLLAGYALSVGIFKLSSPGYLTQAFTLGTSTHIGVQPVLLALAGGTLATCLASIVPLADLRRGRPVDAVFIESESAGEMPEHAARWLAASTASLVLIAGGLFAFVPSAALMACVALALATMLAVPLVLRAVLGVCGVLSSGNSKLTVLPLALYSLKTTTVRSLALAATGAVALFGSIALGGARDDLLQGLHSFAHAYSADADIWVLNPHDTAAANSFSPDRYASEIDGIPGVASVRSFQSEFMAFGHRRVWVIARPPGTGETLLQSQIVEGNSEMASTRLQEGGWVIVSKPIAEEEHAHIGGPLTLPTPAGMVTLKLAAIGTNFGWTSGVVLVSSSDYAHSWLTSAPTALGVRVASGAPTDRTQRRIIAALGPGSGLEVVTARTRAERFDAIAGEGLEQLGEISTLLVAGAILAMAAALGSSIWQRRQSLAELRLDGAPRRQVRLVLLVEAALMLSAGCLTGAIAGVFGQVVIDGYLKHVTGFPVAGVTTSARPLEIFALVMAAVLLIVSLPAWIASRVPARLALNE